MAEVDARRDELIRIADTIHAKPEIAFEEFESAALLSSMLEGNGFALKRGVAGLETAFVATLHGQGGNPTIAFLAEYDAILPNPKLADLVEANMAALGIEVKAPEPNERMGSSDMGNVSQVVPALHPYIAIGPEGTPGHSIEFRAAASSSAGHEGMIKAAKVMAMTAVDLLAVPANVIEARRAFEEQKSSNR